LGLWQSINDEMIGSIIKCALGGRWKTAIFSVTSACNCGCSMCNIPNLPPQHLSLNAAFEILRQCAKNKVAVVSITGGEPFLYPALPVLVREAKEMGIIVHIATNGTLPEKIREVAGYVDAIGFSIDSHVAPEHDGNRRHEGAFEKCLKGVRVCKKMGIRFFANAPPNEYIIGKIEEYVSFINQGLGIPVGFCYPEMHGGNYFSRDKSIISDLSPEQLADFFRAALRLKRSGYGILNTDIFLNEAAEYARGNFQKVCRCGSGRVVYWIDWSGDVRPCFVKKEVLNRKEGWEKFNPNNCNECFTQCFREPSSFLYSLPFSLRGLGTLGSFTLGAQRDRQAGLRQLER